MMARSVRSALMAGSAIVGLMLVSAAPAAAQNSEVQMLRGQVQELLSRIEKLEKAPVAPVPAVAPVPIIAPGNPKVKVTIGGWINRAVTYADNGADDDFLFVDNNGASSRINISASGAVNETFSMGSVLELEAVSNDSRGTGINGASNFRFQERKMEVWLEAKGLGRLWLGQGDTASNVMTEVDLSGTANFGLYSDVGATFGGIGFARETGLGAVPTVNAAMPNYDGLSRDDRIRLDTTSISGFTASIGATNNGNNDAALRYAGKFGGTSVAGTVGYVDFSDSVAATSDLIGGSASVRLANGFSVTFATASLDFRAAGRESGSFLYGKLGYATKFSPIGETAFSVDYYDGSDTFANGSEAVAYGVSLVQQLDAINSTLYLSVRNHEYDVTGSEFDDVFGIMTGARFRF